MNIKKRHQRFADELRKTVIGSKTSKNGRFRDVPGDDMRETDDARIQEELDAKFDELFGFSDDD